MPHLTGPIQVGDSFISGTYGVCKDNSNRIKWGGELAYCVTGSLDGRWSPVWYTTFFTYECGGKISAGQGGPQTHAPPVFGF